MATTAAVMGLAAGASVLTGVMSGLFQSSNTNRQIGASIDAQNSANATNIYLQQEQNKWNAEQIAKQNEYNSPLQQRMRYELAGLNPLLAQMNQGLQPAAAQGQAPHVESAAPLYLEAANLKNQAINSAFDNTLKAAQASLAQAQAKNTEKQTSWIDQLNKGVIDLQNSQISLNTEVQNFTHQQKIESESKVNMFDAQASVFTETALNLIDERRNLLATYDAIKAGTKVSEQQAKEIEQKVKSLEIENIYKAPYYKAFISDLVAHANMSQQQAELFAQQTVGQMLGNDSARLNLQTQYFTFDTNLDSARTSARINNWILHKTEDFKEFDFNLSKGMQVLDITTKFCRTFGEVISLPIAPANALLGPAKSAIGVANGLP